MRDRRELAKAGGKASAAEGGRIALKRVPSLEDADIIVVAVQVVVADPEADEALSARRFVGVVDDADDTTEREGDADVEDAPVFRQSAMSSYSMSHSGQ